MKQILFAIALMTLAAPASAQFGSLGDAAKKATQAKNAVDEFNITDAEERQIGEDVSTKIRARFGVVQDPAIHKYVTLVGTTIAKQSDRPNLNWQFIVLDTDGVNAFASPGGLVHVTRGALGLAKNEAELAGILGHEIGHVVRKHTVNAIKKSTVVKMSSDAAGNRAAVISSFANRAYEMVLENSFDRGDELDADKVGTALAAKAGYAGGALGDFLARLDERNKNQAERNGLFASHPETKERITKIKQGAAASSVLVEPRFKSNVKYEAAALTSIATVTDGSAGLAGSSKEEPKKEEPKKEEPKKKGFGVGAVKETVAPEKQSSQVSASGGARGLGADRAAKGGSNPAIVKTAVTAAELTTFKQGIA